MSENVFNRQMLKVIQTELPRDQSNQASGCRGPAKVLVRRFPEDITLLFQRNFLKKN
jgi:hypothetical protein